MIFNWKSFKIDLEAFLSFLQTNSPNSDGIHANSDYFQVMFKGELSEDEIILIQDYYDSLTE